LRPPRTMDHSFSQQPRSPPLTATHVRLQTQDFGPNHPSRFREAGAPHGLSPLSVSGVDPRGSTPVFPAPDLHSFTGPYASQSSAHGVFGGVEPVPPAGLQRRQQHPPRRGPTPSQRRVHESPGRFPGTPPTNPGLPPTNQFGILPNSSAGSRVGTNAPRTASTDVAKTSPAKSSATLEPVHSSQLPSTAIEEPPGLTAWRQRFFDLEEPMVLASEE